MVTIQGLRRSAAPTSLTPSALAFTLIVFLGLFLALAESSPSGVRSVDGGQGIFDPKRSGAQGFHEGIFDEGFGGFSTLRKRNLRNMAVKRRPEMDPRGFDGDAFTGGFGDFYTMKRSQHPHPDVFLNSLLEGFDDLTNRVSALERKVMEGKH